MVEGISERKSKFIGFLIIITIVTGTIYPVFYATVNNLWGISISNFNGFNFNRPQRTISPDDFSKTVDEVNMTDTKLFENVTRLSVVANGKVVGLSVKWKDLGNIIWKLTVKAPTDGDYTLLTSTGFKDNNHTVFEFSLGGNNVTYYLVINRNYTVLDEISNTATDVGYLNVEYIQSVNKILSVNDLTASFDVGKIVLNLKNCRIQTLDLHSSVASIQLELQNVEVGNLFRATTDVGEIRIEGSNLKVAKDTEVTSNTGSIMFSINNLTYKSNSSTTCYIASDVGSIDFNITLLNSTEARVEAATNVGSVSYDGMGIKVIDEKKTEVILETVNYSEGKGIKFKLASNVGSIDILVIKQ